MASLLLGTVSLGQAAESFVNIWDAALAFIGIVAFSVILDAMGFFKWAALKVVKLAKGSGLRLFFYVSLLTAAVSILFANDSAVLILTPIVLEIISELKIDGNGKMAYLFAAGLIADTAAMPLITSNPINILSADFFGYTFIDHLIFMVPIAVATIASSMLLVYLFFRSKIPKTYDTKLIESLSASAAIKPGLLKLCLATLVAIDVGYVAASLARIPVSIVICSGAVFLLAVYMVNLKHRAVQGEYKGSQRHSQRHQLGHSAFHVKHLSCCAGLNKRWHHRFTVLCTGFSSLFTVSFRYNWTQHRRHDWSVLYE